MVGASGSGYQELIHRSLDEGAGGSELLARFHAEAPELDMKGMQDELLVAQSVEDTKLFDLIAENYRDFFRLAQSLDSSGEVRSCRVLVPARRALRRSGRSRRERERERASERAARVGERVRSFGRSGRVCVMVMWVTPRASPLVSCRNAPSLARRCRRCTGRCRSRPGCRRTSGRRSKRSCRSGARRGETGGSGRRWSGSRACSKRWRRIWLRTSGRAASNGARTRRSRCGHDSGWLDSSFRREAVVEAKRDESRPRAGGRLASLPRAEDTPRVPPSPAQVAPPPRSLVSLWPRRNSTARWISFGTAPW